MSRFQREIELDDDFQLSIQPVVEKGFMNHQQLLRYSRQVAALLVEARAKNHPFDLNDVSDVCTLLQPNTEKNHVNFTHEIDIIEAQPISPRWYAKSAE